MRIGHDNADYDPLKFLLLQQSQSLCYTRQNRRQSTQDLHSFSVYHTIVQVYCVFEECRGMSNTNYIG